MTTMVAEEDAVQKKRVQLAKEEAIVESQEVVVAIKNRIVVIVVKFRNILFEIKIIYFTIL
jgi:hypothetical protein